MKHSLPIYYYNSTYLKLSIFFLLCFQLEIKGQTFTDVSELFQISGIGLNSTYGNGLSFYDFDQDGWDDVTFAGSNDSIHFYKNMEGNLVKQDFGIHVEGDVKQILWVDYDNDGLLDLFLCVNQGFNKLYRNTGSFNFEDVSSLSGLWQNTEPTANYGACFFDFDRDGDLDLYVATYTVGQLAPSRLNKLYRNNGNGTFTDITIDSQVFISGSTSFQSIAADFNNDVWPDLYIINDKVFRNKLFINQGNLLFNETAEVASADLPDQDSMCGAVADFNNDGNIDVFVSNSTSAERNAHLLVNQGDGTFSELANQYGVGQNGISWGALWIDYDNDSWQDLYVASAVMNENSNPTADFFFRSMQGNVFEEFPQAFTSNESTYSYAVARGDLNNDGFYDMIVSRTTAPGNAIYRNGGNSNNFIKISLQGSISNRMAIGSRIQVYANGQVFTQYTMCGEGYLSQNSQHHIFGLANINIIDSVIVGYPSGVINKYFNLAINNTYLFIESTENMIQIQASGDLSFCEGSSVVLDAGEYTSYLWNTSETGRFIEVFESGTYSVSVTLPDGIIAYATPILVNVINPPAVEEIVLNASCFGASDGYIKLTVEDETLISQVLWNGQEGELVINDLPQGSYTYIIVDNFTCETQGTIFLTEPSELNILLLTDYNQIQDSVIVSVFAFGGTPPYMLLVNDVIIPNMEQFTSSIDVDLFVQLIDANSCVAIDTLFQTSTSISSLAIKKISAYPSPFNEKVCIDIDNFSYQLINTKGQVVRKGAVYDNNCILHLNDLKEGMYVLIVDKSGRKQQFRILKQ